MKLIPLGTTKKAKKVGFFAMVDDEDYEELSKYNWSVQGGNSYNKDIYAVRFIHGKGIRMHRQILGETNPKILVDHKDHNGLNNQKSNIRRCTNAQNQQNKTPRGTSRYLWVALHCGKKWLAAITVNKKRIHLGLFDNEIDAAKCYNDAAMIHHKEFANLNVLS